MITLAWYLFKVIICSGILCGYYFLALRNKVFHRWNRFFLLASVVLALLIPLMKINIFQNPDEKKGVAIKVLQTISYGDEVVIEYSRGSGFHINSGSIAGITYLLISGILLILFFISLLKIIKLKKKNPETKINGISFFNTNARGTPFSFFNSIFWNNAIDLHSKPGQQIFNHEIAHVREKHSYDKIFMNLIMVLFWINPFFWLTRKELHMIHEFIADQEALEDNDLNAFAEMILQTVYPGQNFSITNSFFYSPIKRRITMLTKNKNPKVSYLSRLLVLPLAAIVFFAFTLKVKTAGDKMYYDGKTINVVNTKTGSAISEIPVNNDTIPRMYYKGKKVTSLEVNDTKNTVKVKYADGASETVTKEEAKKRGFTLPPPPPPPIKPPAPPKPPVNPQAPPTPPAPPAPPVPVKEISKGKVNFVSPNDIRTVTGSKNESSVDYGEKDTVPDKIYTKTEVESSFPGGTEAWQKYITGKIKETKDSLTEKDFGTCIVKFIIDKNGSVSNVEATTMQGTKLAEIVVNAIKKGPKWNPAMQKGKKVNAYRLQPVTISSPD